jgi:hypothetical protein
MFCSVSSVRPASLFFACRKPLANASNMNLLGPYPA